MVNVKKKVVFLNGSVQLPLKTGARATVYHHGEIIQTSIVTAIKQVAENFIIFETQSSTYCVALSITPDPASMAISAAVA